ncbi:MAG TPA: glutamate--cysteine ligase [Marmoricola sp.]|nr:glutamate--cysteine ligase [Marmoricola sp.]
MRTLGIEEELLVVEADSGRPTAASERVIRRAPWRLSQAGGNDTQRADDEPGGHVGHELQQEQLEIDTPPRTHLADLEQDLHAWRKAAGEAAAEQGTRIVAAGTSPLQVEPRLTPDERYERMVERFGLTAKQQLTCGCHVHVSVESDEEGVAVLDRIRRWLPPLLAISANSPFWQGEDSGYASFRSQAWLRWPSAGPVDVLGSAERYHRLVEELLGSGVVLDEGMVYFDARLSAHYPTVELRVTDVCLDPRDAVLVAALARALVETAARAWQEGEPPAAVPTSLLRLAMWRAGHDGVDGELLDPRTGRPRPADEVLAALLDHARPALEAAGDLDEATSRLAELLRRGNGARRQRQVHARTGSLHDVVADLAVATVAG